MLTAEQYAALRKAVIYLEDATAIIEDDGGDEDDIADAREVVSEARAVLAQIASTETPAGEESSWTKSK